MSTSPTRPDWSDAQRAGPPIARYQGSLLAGGILWLAPLGLLPAAVLSVGRDTTFALVMAGACLAFTAPLVAGWQQTIELYPRHLLWTKWGHVRNVAYSQIEALRSGTRARAAQGSRAGIFEQRFLDLYLSSGEKISWIEISRHDELVRRLGESLAAFREGVARGAAAAATGAGDDG